MISVSIRINDYLSKKDNTAKLYIRVAQSGCRDRKIPLEIRWNPEYFNEDAQEVLPILPPKPKPIERKLAQEKADLVNLELAEIKLRAKQILEHARQTRKVAHQDWFISHYHGNFLTDNFLEYMRRRLAQNLKDKLLTPVSVEQYSSVINKLEKYYPTLSFNDFDKYWANKFDKKMEHEGLRKTTAFSYHNAVKKFLFYAADDNISFTNPYDYFKLSKGRTSTRSSSLDDILTVYRFVKTSDDARMKMVARRFLFAVFTGLRLSDIKQIKEVLIDRNKIKFTPFKQRKKQNELIRQLSEEAVEILELEMAENPEKPFTFFTDSNYCILLKDLGKQLELQDTRLHTHKGRRTFASFMINNHILSLKELQSYFDHSDISTTAKYLDADEEVINTKIESVRFMPKND